MGDYCFPKSSRYTQIILDNITDGVFSVNLDFQITLFNHAAELITGIQADEAIGRYCHEIFRSTACEKDCPLRQTLKTGDPVVSRKIQILNSKGKPIPISVSTAVLRDDGGPVLGCVETFRDLSVVHALRKELDNHYSFSDIISKNAVMKRIFSTLPQIAESESCVLIEGESGTGKELFARVIHQLSHRKNRQLVAVNCGALPDSLLESELFGHKAGAFTDAKTDRQGRFAQAEKSTLLLDEIGDISPAFQVRLLRVLQEHVYEPLGSSKPVKADVRVIASTNKNLSELVENGTFRRDLYYRINIIRILIPPLRERKEDLGILVNHFLEKFNKIMDKNVEGVSTEVMHVLMKHSFPGNVRELENIVEHAMVLCSGSLLQVEDLPPELFEPTHPPSNWHSQLTPEDVERKLIMETLERNEWNRQAAANELGIHKTTLFRKIKALGLVLPEQDGRSAQHIHHAE